MTNKQSGKQASGFFADTLGPNPSSGALLGKNGAAPQQQPERTQSPPQAQKAAAPQPSRAAAPSRQPEPEPPKKKKGWF